MILYKVLPDSNFCYLYPDKDLYQSSAWSFNASRVFEKLGKLNASFQRSLLKPLPDIAWLGEKTFAVSGKTGMNLVDILENAGEVYPLDIRDDVSLEWYWFNVLIKSDALKFNLNSGLTLCKKKLPKSSLVKFSYDNYTDLYCLDRRDSDDQVLNNFLCSVAGSNLRGVRFEKVNCNVI